MSLFLYPKQKIWKLANPTFGICKWLMAFKQFKYKCTVQNETTELTECTWHLFICNIRFYTISNVQEQNYPHEMFNYALIKVFPQKKNEGKFTFLPMFMCMQITLAWQLHLKSVNIFKSSSYYRQAFSGSCLGLFYNL